MMFAFLSLCLEIRRFCGWLLLEILFPDDVVTHPDSFARGFDLFGIEHQRRAVANHVDHKSVGRLGQDFC